MTGNQHKTQPRKSNLAERRGDRLEKPAVKLGGLHRWILYTFNELWSVRRVFLRCSWPKVICFPQIFV